MDDYREIKKYIDSRVKEKSSIRLCRVLSYDLNTKLSHLVELNKTTEYNDVPILYNFANIDTGLIYQPKVNDVCMIIQSYGLTYIIGFLNYEFNINREDAVQLVLDATEKVKLLVDNDMSIILGVKDGASVKIDNTKFKVTLAIQADNYITSDGSTGITQTVTVVTDVGPPASTKSLVFKNGILTDVI